WRRHPGGGVAGGVRIGAPDADPRSAGRSGTAVCNQEPINNLDQRTRAMKLLKHVMAAGLAVAIGSIPAAAQQSNITLRVASFAGPFGEGLQKYSGDLFTTRTGMQL